MNSSADVNAFSNYIMLLQFLPLWCMNSDCLIIIEIPCLRPLISATVIDKSTSLPIQWRNVNLFLVLPTSIFQHTVTHVPSSGFPAVPSRLFFVNSYLVVWCMPIGFFWRIHWYGRCKCIRRRPQRYWQCECVARAVCVCVCIMCVCGVRTWVHWMPTSKVIFSVWISPLYLLHSIANRNRCGF